MHPLLNFKPKKSPKATKNQAKTKKNKINCVLLFQKYDFLINFNIKKSKE